MNRREGGSVPFPLVAVGAESLTATTSKRNDRFGPIARSKIEGSS